MRVAPPSAGSAALCAKLHDRLPATLAGLDRRDTEPRSSRTAAWGSPPVVLRCGVPAPAGVTGGDVAPVTVDGVAWLAHYGGTTFDLTAVDRPVYVEVAIPRSSDVRASVLTGLAPAIQATLAERPLPTG